MLNSKTNDQPKVTEERLQVKVRGKVRDIVVPGEEEDAAITLAALDDPDNPPLTHEQLAQLKPVRRPGRPPADSTKVPTSIRLDNVVLDSFKNTGDGWQTRINAALREYLEQHKLLAHRYRATVRKRGDKLAPMDEFLVVARNDGEARRKVQEHLRQAGREEDARGEVSLDDVGNAVLRDLAVIR